MVARSQPYNKQFNPSLPGQPAVSLAERRSLPGGGYGLSKGKTIEELRAERGAHRVATVPEAVELVKRWGRVPLNPLCGGCPPELAWTYLRRIVDDVIPALRAAPKGSDQADRRG